MIVGNDRDIALSMIRFWGNSARSVAHSYAQDYVKRSDTGQAQKWSKVGQLITQIETPASAHSVQKESEYSDRPVSLAVHAPARGLLGTRTAFSNSLLLAIKCLLPFH
jgi:hypothetical protein